MHEPYTPARSLDARWDPKRGIFRKPRTGRALTPFGEAAACLVVAAIAAILVGVSGYGQ